MKTNLYATNRFMMIFIVVFMATQSLFAQDDFLFDPLGESNKSTAEPWGKPAPIKRVMNISYYTSFVGVTNVASGKSDKTTPQEGELDFSSTLDTYSWDGNNHSEYDVEISLSKLEQSVKGMSLPSTPNQETMGGSSGAYSSFNGQDVTTYDDEGEVSGTAETRNGGVSITRTWLKQTPMSLISKAKYDMLKVIQKDHQVYDGTKNPPQTLTRNVHYTNDSFEVNQSAQYSTQHIDLEPKGEECIISLDGDEDKSERKNTLEYLIPLQVKITHGLVGSHIVIKQGAYLAFTVINAYMIHEARPSVTWQYSQLDDKGLEGTWKNLGTGDPLVAIMPEAGIFHVRALVNGAEIYYKRDFDDKEIGNPVNYGYRKLGEKDCIGVCETDEQIAFCKHTQLYYDSTEFKLTDNIPAKYGFMAVAKDEYKCNIFLAHMAAEVDLIVPKTGGRWNLSPPSANQWFGSEWTVYYAKTYEAATYIPHWYLMPTNSKPQPGWIVASNGSAGSGHCAVVDYDGEGIGAGASGTVNRRWQIFFNGTQRYRKYVK